MNHSERSEETTLYSGWIHSISIKLSFIYIILGSKKCADFGAEVKLSLGSKNGIARRPPSNSREGRSCLDFFYSSICSLDKRMFLRSWQKHKAFLITYPPEKEKKNQMNLEFEFSRLTLNPPFHKLRLLSFENIKAYFDVNQNII